MQSVDLFGDIGYSNLTRREVEQLAARRAHNPEAVGSNPTLAIERPLRDEWFFVFKTGVLELPISKAWRRQFTDFKQRFYAYRLSQSEVPMTRPYSLFKKSNGYYYVQFLLADRSRSQNKSTGTKDRREAKSQSVDRSFNSVYRVKTALLSR